MRGRWAEIPFLAPVLPLGFGILLSRLIRSYSFAGLAAGGTLLAVSALIALRRGRHAWSLSLGLAAIAVAGLLLALAERDGMHRHDLRALLSRELIPLGRPVLFDGCAVEDGTGSGRYSVVTIRIRGLRLGGEWMTARGKILLRVAETGTEEEEPVPGSTLRYGDRIRGWVELDLPRNFRNPGSIDRVGYLSRQGVRLTGRVKSPRLLEVLRDDCGMPWFRAAASVRRQLQGQIRTIDTNDGGREAVLSSLLLGDYSNLDSFTREIFQNSGTYHILVVSGLHVAWIAWILIGLSRLLRAPPGISRLFVAAAILGYALVVGFRAGITRSLWVFALYLAGEALFRRSSPSNTLLAAGFILLAVHPDRLFDAGFQLSFLSVAAILLTALPAVERCLRPLLLPLRHAGDQDRLVLEPGRWHRLGRRLRFEAELLAEAWADRRNPFLEKVVLTGCRVFSRAGLAIGSMVMISLSVQLWLGPVLAFYFNRLSWIVPAANLLVVPLSSLVLAAGAGAALLGTVVPSGFALSLAGSLADRLLAVTSWFSDLPGAWQRCPTPSALWTAAGVLTLLLWSSLNRRRVWIPCAILGLQLLCLAGASSPAAPLSLCRLIAPKWHRSDSLINPALRLTFLDVGQGDCEIIEFPDGRVWALDAGGLTSSTGEEEDAGYDIGEFVVSRYLWYRWIPRLDRAVLSHPHQDHAGGFPALLKNFRTAGLDHGPGSGAVLDRLVATAQENSVPVRSIAAPRHLEFAGVSVDLLYPPHGPVPASVNDSSLVFRLAYGRFSALMAGDLERSGEMSLLAHARSLDSMLLKVAHHGSRSATLEPFLDRVRPRWAVVSAGKSNPFGNPAPETLLRLVRHGARPLLTQDLGAIVFETDGRNYVLWSHVAGTLEKGTL